MRALKKIRGVPQHDRPQVRYAFIHEPLTDPKLHGMPLSERCRVLEVGSSGYYEWFGRQGSRPRKKPLMPKRAMLSDETVLTA